MEWANLEMVFPFKPLFCGMIEIGINWNVFYHAMMHLKSTHASNYLDDDEYDENK